MRRDRRSTRWRIAAWRGLLGAAALAGLAGTARAEEATAPLTGAAAVARLVGNTISGRTPDGPYDEFFAPGGTLAIVDGDGKAGGSWHLRQDRLCSQVEGEDGEECRNVTVTGTEGAFTDEAGSRYPFTLAPGNPKGL